MLPHLLERIINIRHHQWSVYLTACTFINAILFNIHNIYFLFVLLQYVTTIMPILNLFTSYNVLTLINNKHRNRAIVDYTSPTLCTPVTPFPTTGDAFYRQHAAGGLNHGHRQHAQKIGKDRARGSGYILTDRHTDRHTDTHTHHHTSQPLPWAK